METPFPQTRALALLMIRFWRRGPLPSVYRSTSGRRASGFILRLVFVLLFANVGHTYGKNCVGASSPHPVVAVEWLMIALAGLAVSFGFASAGPGLRGIQSPLNAPLLDALPLREASRVAVMVLQNVTIHALAVAAVYGASPGLGAMHAAAVGLTLSTAGLVVGAALIRLLRISLSPMRVAKVATRLVLFQLPCFFLMVFAPQLAGWRAATPWAHPAWILAMGVVDLGHTPPALLGLTALGAAAAAFIAWAERVGYDRIDTVPTRRLTSATGERLTLARVERLLVKREPTGRAVWIMVAYSSFIAGGLLFLGYHFKDLMRGDAGSGLLRTSVAITTFMAFTAASSRASRLAERDVVARPLLAPLPIAPSDLLQGKAVAIRRQTLFIALPLVAILALPGGLALHEEAAWRVGTMMISLALTSSAAVAVAFLTAGLGGTTQRAGIGTSFSLETMLLLIPVIRVATAPYLWSAVVSLGCVGLLAVEARRAALGCVRWLDDADAFDRETPVWRALLVFTAFQAAQSLAVQVLHFSGLAAETSLAIAYMISATGLLALTFYERRGLPPLPWRPKRPSLLALGAALGLASGGLALGYARILVRLGAEPGLSGEGWGRYLFGAAVVLAAPIAEEVFFRGWLQDVIHQQYAARGARFALVITAFAFAAIHPPLSFPPVLVLGLVAGWLFFRTGNIAAGIAAHAMHNLVVVLWQ